MNEDFAARLAEEKRKLQAAVLDRETQAAGVESELEQQRQQLVCCGRGGEGKGGAAWWYIMYVGGGRCGTRYCQ